MQRGLASVGFITAALLIGCTRPTQDHATLAAIKSETSALIQAHPTEMKHPLAKADWPKAIATLNPAFVSVERNGVEIMVQPDFDGGYGYYVLRKGQKLPGPPRMYTKLDAGIYWHRPY